MNIYQTLTDVGSVNEHGQTVLCRMTEFNELTYKSIPEPTTLDHTYIALNNVLVFSRLLSSPVTLGDFVPTNEKGEVLEKPLKFEAIISGKSEWTPDKHWMDQCQEYEAACERVLFEGFETYTAKTDKVNNVKSRVKLKELDF